MLRGFRDVKKTISTLETAGISFNTPEGVEGFSSRRPRRWRSSRGCLGSFNTPEGVEGFSSGPSEIVLDAVHEKLPPGFNTPEGVEGFSSSAQPAHESAGQMARRGGFNTPEGVEGFSRRKYHGHGV